MIRSFGRAAFFEVAQAGRASRAAHVIVLLLVNP